jgi:hypothetical protein
MSYNRMFTDLIRQQMSNPYMWGTWSLDSEIKPGAIGFLSATNGDFKFYDDLGRYCSCGVEETAAESHWQIKSKGVEQRSVSVAASKAFGFEWSFSQENSMVSSFKIASQRSLKDFGSLINANLQHVSDIARKMGHIEHGEKIAQGVAVVTSVIYARSGLNVVSTSKNSKFQLTASIPEEVEYFLRTGGAKGSYEAEKSEGALLRHLWPTAGSTNAELRPIAYEVASFAEGRLVPQWNRILTPFELKVNTKGAMSTDYVLTYETDRGVQDGGKLKDQGAAAEKTFERIPIHARNVQLRIVGYKAGGNYDRVITWLDPKLEWTTNAKRVELHAATAFSNPTYEQTDI